jgi:uncharacterized protein (DUF427 family)
VNVWNDSAAVGVSPNMTKAVFDGVVIAESDDVKVVEGISYFPLDSVTPGVLSDSPTTSRCFWKGQASYFHVDSGNDTSLDSAFQYKQPWPLAKKLVTDRVGFWRGVAIEK